MVLPQSKGVRSQHSWIDAARFESVSQQAILQEILAEVRAQSRERIKHGGKPVSVVFDLDSTIFDVKPRTLRIMKEFAGGKASQAFAPELREWCMNLQAHQLSYTIRDTAAANSYPIRAAGAEEFMKALFQYWLARFFTDQYLYTDLPAPGAQDYVHAVVDAGAVAVYLTGRDEPGMGRGTRSLLRHWGFPVGERETRLLLKPNYGADDAEFKDEALKNLRVHSEALALFDNEPANFHVFEKNFPQARLVFCYTNCSTKEAKPVERIYRIDNFLFR